jgi:glycosyltransferase involved in cell wall biosynthesis
MEALFFMRILYLAPHPFFAPRGTPIAVKLCLEALSAQGHRIDVVTYHEGTGVDIPGVRLLRINRPPMVKKVPIGPSWQKLLCDVALYRLAVRLVKSGRYDLVHAGEEGAFIADWLERWYKLPFVYDMDSLMSDQVAKKSKWLRPVAFVFQLFEQHAIRHSRGVLAVCPALVDQAKPHQPGGRVSLLPDVPLLLDCDLSKVPAMLREAPGRRLVYVGNLEKYQGIDLLLESFAKVAHKRHDATLVIVGGREDHIAHYKHKAGSLVEQGRVRFTGPVPVEHLGSVLGSSDVLLSPRIEGENTPMKLYSYLMSGRPVIATDLPTHTQVIDASVALLAQPTAEAFSQAVLRVLDDPAMGDALGRAGQVMVENLYSAPTYRRRLASFYDAVQHELTGIEPTPVPPRPAPVKRAA